MKEDKPEDKLTALRDVVSRLREEGRPAVNWQGGDRAEENGPITFGFVVMTRAQMDAMRVLYDHGLIIYDALNSIEYRDLYENLNPDRPLDLNIVDTRKTLIHVSRMDRFGGDDWARMFASGKGLALFERWLELEEDWATRDVQIVDGHDRLRDVTRLLHEHIDSLLWDSRETREFMDIEQTEAELANPGALYAPPGGRLLLTLLDDAPVALLALKPHSPDTAEITRLYVQPDARGYGLASQLLDKAVDTARAVGYRQVVLSLMPEMEMVRDMCYRHDFTSIEPYNNDAPDGLIPMGMSLT